MKENIVIAVMVVALIVVAGTILRSKMISNAPDVSQPTTASQTQQTPHNQSPADVGKEKTAAVAKGLKIEDTQQGSGKEAKTGDTVIMNYKGTLENGTVFDSSYVRGQPFTTQIGVGQVIKGWDLGVPGMKVGGKRRLTIPAEFGYGAQATGKIPANSTLFFDVELMDVK